MNEQFIVRLTQDNQPLPLTELVAIELDRGGVILNGETSAWPRGLRFDFQGVGTFKGILNDLRRQTAGGNHRFRLAIDNGELAITTVLPNRIPTGSYDLRLRIADLDLQGNSAPLSLNEGDPPIPVPLIARPERHTIRLEDSVQADQPIADLVNGNSTLDGRSVRAWLGASAPRAKRKACLLNLLATLRTTPTPEVSLIRHVQQVFHADVDRIYARVDRAFFDLLQELDEDPLQPFSADHGPLHPTHLKLLRRLPPEDQDATEQYVLTSFRQDTQPSLQIVVAMPPNDRPGRGVYADIDIDLGNPKRDLAGFFIHLGEVMSEGQTDHLKLNKRLTKNPIVSGHLHYTITTPS